MRKRTAGVMKWLGIVLLAWGVVYAVLLLVSGAKLRRAYAALEAAGRPMRVEDIVPPEIPDYDNAALLYESAALRLKSARVEYIVPEMQQLGYRPAEIITLEARHETNSLAEALRDVRVAMSVAHSGRAEIEAELRRLLERPEVGEAFALVAEATTRPACRFDVDFSQGGAMMVPHLSSMLSMSRILASRARLRAAAGDAAAAWVDVELGLRMADGLRNEPIVMGQLVRVAINATMLDVIPDVCAVASPEVATYNRLDETLRNAESSDFDKSFDGERLLVTESTFAMPRSEWVAIARDGSLESELTLRKRLLHLLWIKPVRQADHATYLEYSKRVSEILGKPCSHEDQVVLEELEKSTPWYALATSRIMPRYAEIVRQRTRELALIRIARAGLAALHYRESTGAFPERLLLPNGEEAIDPFADQPLVYLPGEDEFLLYSRGQNLVDDGGAEDLRDRTQGDLAWRFPAEAPVQ